MVWDGTHLFECPTRVFYGFGAANGLGERLGELGVSRALVVSDPGVGRSGPRRAGYRPSHGLPGSTRSPTRDTEQNPTTTNLAEIADLYAESAATGWSASAAVARWTPRRLPPR